MAAIAIAKHRREKVRVIRREPKREPKQGPSHKEKMLKAQMLCPHLKVAIDDGPIGAIRLLVKHVPWSMPPTGICGTCEATMPASRAEEVLRDIDERYRLTAETGDEEWEAKKWVKAYREIDARWEKYREYVDKEFFDNALEGISQKLQTDPD